MTVSVRRLPPAGRLREDSQTPALEKALRGWAGALETVSFVPEELCPDSRRETGTNEKRGWYLWTRALPLGTLPFVRVLSALQAPALQRPLLPRGSKGNGASAEG